jgi:hypothetical protein
VTREGWSGDDAVGFVEVLRRVNGAKLWAIRLELATWAYGDETLHAELDTGHLGRASPDIGSGRPGASGYAQVNLARMWGRCSPPA